MQKKELIILIILTVVISNLIFLFSYKMLVYDQDFYEKEFKNNGVYDKYNKTFVDEQHKEVIGFLITDQPIITSDHFSKQDKEHLRDVEVLMKKIDYFSYVFVISLLIVFVYLHVFYKKLKDKIFTLSVFYSSMINLITLGILYLLSLNFDWFFTKFHELSFDNNLWMMNPAKDMLVNLYPETFWINAFSRIMLTILVLSLIFTFIGYLGYYFISKHTKLKEKNIESKT
jgi:integral membrane protein (TIGR01906 family)